MLPKLDFNLMRSVHRLKGRVCPRERGHSADRKRKVYSINKQWPLEIPIETLLKDKNT